jgi:hypothetical protein
MFELTMAFGTAKAELLAVIPHKDDSVSRINGGRTKVALFDPHDSGLPPGVGSVLNEVSSGHGSRA